MQAIVSMERLGTDVESVDFWLNWRNTALDRSDRAL